MKKVKPTIAVIGILLIIFIAWLDDVELDIFRDYLEINGWERISYLESNFLGFIQVDSENNILWMKNSSDPLLKKSLLDLDDFKEVTFDSVVIIRNMCIGRDSVFLIGGGDVAYLVDKLNLTVEDFTEFHRERPTNCLVDSQENIIVFNQDWFGVYKEENWQFFEKLSFEGEGLEIEKILAPTEKSLLMITEGNRLFKYSITLDDLSYIGELPVKELFYRGGGIASNKVMWLSSDDGYFYSWLLPIDDENLAPKTDLYSSENLALGVFIDSEGRTWIIRQKDIVVLLSRDDIISIKPPYGVDRITSVFVDEDTSLVYLGTDSGVYRSSFEKLAESNGLE